MGRSLQRLRLSKQDLAPASPKKPVKSSGLEEFSGALSLNFLGFQAAVLGMDAYFYDHVPQKSFVIALLYWHGTLVFTSGLNK
jgi:hypothetical protein